MDEWAVLGALQLTKEDGREKNGGDEKFYGLSVFQNSEGERDGAMDNGAVGKGLTTDGSDLDRLG